MTETLLQRRARVMGAAPIFYDTPLEFVRGAGCWLYTPEGRRYLDAYNNVPHLGHGHPAVVEAVARQAATLNVHSRYLHEGVIAYLERLTARVGLDQALMACTGSEAMDVALRMAQAATGALGVIATDNTYHGNTAAVSALSTRRPPVGGRPAHVRLVPAPDALKGLDAEGFGQAIAAAAEDLRAAGHGVSALVLCPTLANEGLPCPPPGFLQPAAEAIHKAGGLLIADEVQPGFGRLGSHWWGFAQQGIAPDIVVLGKPMGNGYPVAACLAREGVMTAFRDAFGYFNTFAATPVAAAAATAVLEVLETSDLIAQADRTGAGVRAGLQSLRHPGIADVRGQGLFFAVEFADASGPRPDLAHATVEGLKAQGVLAGRIGRQQHILKLRPPMVFGPQEGEILLEALRKVVGDLPDE